MLIPGLILKQMYTLGSLENVEDGVRFSLKNRLSNATLTKLNEVRINGQAVPIDRLTMELAGDRVAASAVSPSSAIAFPLAKVVSIHVRGDQLAKGQHDGALDGSGQLDGVAALSMVDGVAQRVILGRAVGAARDR